jgi:capsular polysaccharide biosynthesis protein
MFSWLAARLRALAFSLEPQPIIVVLACLVAAGRRFGGVRPRGLRSPRRPCNPLLDVTSKSHAVIVSDRRGSPVTGHAVTLIDIDPIAWEARFGARKIREGNPALLEVEDAYVFPQHRALYDANGDLIASSVRPVTGRRQMPTFAAPASVVIPRDPVEYPGHLLYASTLHQHFGHFLVEGISRLWPLSAEGTSRGRFDAVLCDRENPFLGATFRRPVLDLLFPRPAAPRFACRPTRVRRVSIPEPTWVYWGDAHQRHVDIPRRVAEHLGSDIQGTDQPLYLTREHLPGFRRVARSEALLTNELRRHGVRVLAPERLSMTEQIRAVLQHRVVIGLVGSALHATLFAAGSERLTVYLVDPAELPQPTFPVQDALTGIPAAYIGCYRADTESSKGGADRDVVLDASHALSSLQRLGLLR